MPHSRRFPLFLAKPDEGHGGDSTNLTIEQQLTAAQSQVATLTRERDQVRSDLAAAQASISSITGERDQALSDLANAQSQITTLTTDLNQARVDHAAALGNVNALTAERDTARTNLIRIESYCKLQGIDPAKLPAPGNNEQPQSLTEQLANTSDPKERARLRLKALDK